MCDADQAARTEVKEVQGLSVQERIIAQLDSGFSEGEQEARQQQPHGSSRQVTPGSLGIQLMQSDLSHVEGGISSVQQGQQAGEMEGSGHAAHPHALGSSGQPVLNLMPSESDVRDT